IATADGLRPITDEERALLKHEMAQYQSRGMRTLAFAYRESDLKNQELDSLADKLTWLGVVAIADPIRSDVPAAVAACRAAGVQVKIVTGDSEATAREIARQIGLVDSPPMTGPQFAALDDATAAKAAQQISVLARARPADKLRLVRLLKSQ